MKFSVKQIIYLIGSLGVSVGMFYWLFQHTEWSRIQELLLNTRPAGVALFLLWSFMMSVCRTWRYALVLDLSGYHPGRVALFLTTLVRNFFSDLLPARLGTLIYVYLTTTRLGVPFGAAASSFAMAFIFDFLALVPLVLIAALGFSAGALLPVWAWVAFAALLAVGSAMVLLLLPWGGRFAADLIEKPLFKPLNRLGSPLRDASAEVERAKQAGLYGRLMVLSVLVRLGKYGSMYWLLVGMLLPLGYGLADLEPAKIFICLLAPEVAQSLPVSGIGGFGAYEFALAYAMDFLGFPSNLAKESAFAHHLFTQVYGWGLGLVALLVLLLPLFKTSETASEATPKKRPALRFYLGVASFVFVWAGLTWLGASLL